MLILQRAMPSLLKLHSLPKLQALESSSDRCTLLFTGDGIEKTLPLQCGSQVHLIPGHALELGGHLV